MGRVDLHCHLLWATDDGAADAEESLALCSALAGAGFSDAAPSPHAWPELPDMARNQARRAELQALLDARGVPLRLHPGAENRLDGELLERVARGDARPIGGGPWVLVEAPHRVPLANLEELCFRLQVAGLLPLLAHPERCRSFFDDKALARRLVESGCALQIEVGSLAGVYGRDARKLAATLLDKGLAAVAATDVHHLASATRILGEGLEALEAEVGAAGLARLLEENPRRILAGERLLR